MTVVDDIKAKLDIVAYIQQYTTLRKTGRTHKGLCLFHAEKTPSMIVDSDRQTFKCFGCGAGGDIFKFAQLKHGWSFAEALQELGRQAGVEVRKQSPEQKAQDDRRDVLRGLMASAADYYAQQLLNEHDVQAVGALTYTWEKRGFSGETIERFGVGYAPSGWQNILDHLKLLGYNEDQIIETGMAVRNEQGRVYDRFRNRLMIAIRDERGRVIGFGARALDPEDNPKYLNSPQTLLFDKSRTLFALDVAKNAIRDSETVVIVEGYMDAIQAHQAGFTNVVAQMGTALTEAQLKLLARWTKRIVLALDSDAAGQSATMRSLEVAREVLQMPFARLLTADIRVLEIPGAKDPDDLIREDPNRWLELINSATPVADYVIDKEVATLPANASIQEREALAQRLLPILVASDKSQGKTKAATANFYKSTNVQKLALKLRIFEPKLVSWALQISNAPLLRRSTTPSSPTPPATSLVSNALVSDYRETEAHGDENHDASTNNPKQNSFSHQITSEEYCLRILFENPDLYYQVNRKLRELAGDNRKLLDGPLGELCAEDFSQSDCRALMQVFREAMIQDDMETFDFLRTMLDSSLAEQLDKLMVHELDDLHHKLRYGLFADFTDLRRSHEKRVLASVDWGSELVKEALRLREQRLKRERQDMRFLQMDVQDGADYGTQVHLSQLAKRLIDAELDRQQTTTG